MDFVGCCSDASNQIKTNPIKTICGGWCRGPMVVCTLWCADLGVWIAYDGECLCAVIVAALGFAAARENK